MFLLVSRLFCIFSLKSLHIPNKSCNFAPTFDKKQVFLMKKTVLWIVVSLLFAACAGPKQLSYMQDLQDGETIAQAQIPAYRLQTGDQLTIRVSSFDHSAVAPFNVQNAQLADIPYIINEAGYLACPGLGTMQVAGKTVAEVTELLQERVAQLAKGAIVRVELISAFVSVLGEVQHPARIRWPQQGLTLPEALTDAGDLRANASRKIIVLRKQPDGTKSIVVDLTKKDCISSPAWQLQPGDVVYVAPRRGRLIY